AFGKHLVEYDSKRKDVTAGIQGLPGGLLGGHIGDCADHHSWTRVLLRQRACGFDGSWVSQQFRQAEIRQLRVTAPGNQNIGGLYVAMQNASGVGTLKASATPTSSSTISRQVRW